MALADRLALRVVPFAEWRREIAPLWLMEGATGWIPRLLGGHGQLRYAGEELAGRVLLFPVAAELDGRRIGWTSAYNLSDEAIRLRGIYVLPEFRAMGVGRRLAAFACALWPPPWRRCFIYARAANVALYERWGFAAVPGHAARASDLDRVLPGVAVVLMARDLAPGDGAAAAGDERAARDAAAAAGPAANGVAAQPDATAAAANHAAGAAAELGRSDRAQAVASGIAVFHETVGGPPDAGPVIAKPEGIATPA